jgi:hypothetical protein
MYGNYAVWANDGLATIPSVNLVLNIGFCASATHTTDPENPRARVPSGRSSFRWYTHRFRLYRNTSEP